MSAMPGNVAAAMVDAIATHSRHDDPSRWVRAQVQATIAVAEEQRTANLLALLAAESHHGLPAVDGIERDAVIAEVLRRLDVTPQADR